MHVKNFVGLCSLLLALALVATSAPGAVAQAPTPNPLSLNIRAFEPLTIDPALATDTSSNLVVDQLFAGLTRIDDATGEAVPDLAASWTVSPDGRVFTFTLRDGLAWSDGTPLRAEHVRYGVLRSLDPATDAGYASVLYPIVNAEAYHTGAITDPNQVGVTALDATHIRFTLRTATAWFTSIASMGVARPVPAWVINTWGNAWTEPGHIVTSGPYRLSEWQHNHRITLTKNPVFYAANAVQIEQINMLMFADDTTAWQSYLDGNLDTVAVPGNVNVRDDPILGQQFETAPQPCTYYYGFNVTRPPFDNPLVRKAFVAALDRQEVIDTIGGLQQPALTFTPPGIFGHVDGQTEGVGIPFDPAQARQWLAQAGYPNGQGLPPISLWYNTSQGHQVIAEHVRQSWIDNLGVTVTLQHTDWQSYLQRLNNGEFQVWRFGWCADYNDAYNFLHDPIVPASQRPKFGNWSNPTYEALLAQAAVTADPTARKTLYKQAEEILVETDAVMAPIYFYAYARVNRPYLERTSAAHGEDYVASWRLDFADEAAIAPAATTVFAPTVDYVTYEFPAGVLPANATVMHTARRPGELPGAGDLINLGRAFEVMASAAGQPVQPSGPYTLVVRYGDLERGPAVESTLALYYWEGSQWVREPTSVVDGAANTITATPNHFSTWIMLGEVRRTYLPVLNHGR